MHSEIIADWHLLQQGLCQLTLDCMSAMSLNSIPVPEQQGHSCCEAQRNAGCSTPRGTREQAEMLRSVCCRLVSACISATLLKHDHEETHMHIHCVHEFACITITRKTM